jgi:hypothetical protein
MIVFLAAGGEECDRLRAGHYGSQSRYGAMLEEERRSGILSRFAKDAELNKIRASE